MATVNVLIAVNVEGATSSGNLGENVFLVDTNGYAGSGGEGTDELKTSLNIGDIVVWAVAPIDPGTNVEFGSGQPFSGTAVSDGYIDPQENPTEGSWASKFQPPGNTPSGTQFQYTVTLQFDNADPLSFDPFLVVA